MAQQYFPAININKVDGGFEAVLGLDMKTILKGDLFYEDKSSSTSDYMHTFLINERKMIVHRESFIRAISAWPPNIVLEFLFTSLPNLRYSAQGRMFITIVLRVRAKDATQARKDAVAKYLSLRVLLAASVSEADFEPIMDRNDLIFRLEPFKPKHAITIGKRSENIQISEPIEKKTVAGLAGADRPAKEAKGAFVKYTYPWKPSFNDWSDLISVMMGQLDPLHLCIRLKPGKLTEKMRRSIEDKIQLCELYLGTGKSYQLSMMQRTSMLRSALANQLMSLSAEALNIGVFMYAGHDIDASLAVMVGQSITARSYIKDSDSCMSGGFAVSPISLYRATNSRYFPDKEYYSVSEAAAAFRLPSPPVKEVPGLPIRRSRTLLALLPDVAHEVEDGVDLCRNIHSGMLQPVRLPADDRMRHMVCLGQTGCGKSTMMEYMIVQDIFAGCGLAVIDPHGEMVDNILGKIPDARMDDVILFDVLDRERPLGFNLLSYRTLEERDFIIDELYTTLDQMYDMRSTGGPMFESYMRGMLRLQMGSKRFEDYKPTLLEFNNCFVDEEFRHWLVDRNDERITRDFIKEVEKAGGEAHLNNMSPYVTSKFNRFINDATLKNILGQEESSLNFEEIMAQGKILLVKLGKGRLGSLVSSLLANQLVAHFKHAAMKRGEMRPEERRDFYLYVDECQNLPASNFTELLSEARKYRMGLVLATQHASQLRSMHEKNDLLSAILGNVGCLNIFRLGQEDASLLEQSLYPYFSAMDIIGLPNWQGYCRLQIRNHAVTPFSFESVKDKTPYDHKVARKIRDLSRQKYGCDVETIKKQIEKRQNIWKEIDE